MRAARRRTARASASTIRLRSAAASSSVSVRSVEPNATPERERPLARADLLAAVLVEDARPTAARRRRPPRGSRRAGRRGHVLVDDEREILPHLRVRAHLLELDRPPATRATSASRSSSNAPHVPSSTDGMQLADPALVRARRLARVQERLASSARTTARPSARRTAARRPTSRRRSRRRRCRRRASARPAARRPRAVGARDLEQRNLGRADGDVVSRCVDEAPERASCEARRPPVRSARAGAGRLRRRTSRCTPPRSRSRRARPRRVGAAAATASAARTSTSRSGSVNGISSMLEARDLLDQVDLPRHVARAPRRHAQPAVRSCSKPSAARIAACRPTARRARGPRSSAPGRSVIDRGRRAVFALTSACPVQRAPASSTISPRRQRRRRTGEVRVDALLPAVRAFGAEREPLGRAQERDRLEVRGLEQHRRRAARRPRSPRRP